MCGGSNPISQAINKAQDFAPLRDTFGDNIDYAISPLLSGNQTATGGFAATPGSYAEKKYGNLGVDQMVPTLNMFAQAIAGAGAANYFGGGGSGEGAFPADAEAVGTSAPNAPAGGAPSAGSDTLTGNPSSDQLYSGNNNDPGYMYDQNGNYAAQGQGGNQMPPAQALNPETLNAMGLQQTVPGQFSQGGVPVMPTTPTGNYAPQQPATPQAPAQGQPGASGQAPGDQSQQLPGQQAPQGQPGQQAPQGGKPTTQQQPGTVEKILESMKNNPLGTASIAMLGANALAARPKQNQAVQQQQQISAQAQQQAQQLLAQYQSGTLSPGQQAQLDQLTNNTKNQLRQYFASIGQSDSTAAVQSLAQVDAQAQQMKQQMLDNALSQGLSALGIAAGPLNSVANYQLGQDKQLRDAFGNFATQVGTIFGRQSAQTPAQGTQTPSNQTTTQPAEAISSTDPNNPSPP